MKTKLKSSDNIVQNQRLWLKQGFCKENLWFRYCAGSETTHYYETKGYFRKILIFNK